MSLWIEPHDGLACVRACEVEERRDGREGADGERPGGTAAEKQVRDSEFCRGVGS